MTPLLEKTTQLAQRFGFCKKTMLQILHDMQQIPEYAQYVLVPISKNGCYRANPEAVNDYLLGRRSR